MNPISLTSRRSPALVVLVALLAAVLAASLLVAGPAEARKKKFKRVTSWAPVSKAVITPGVQMYTKGAQCTANFVFTDKRGRVYVGYAAHCAGLGEATDTNGCENRSLPLGTKVDFVQGGSLITAGRRLAQGRLVYSSWITENRIGTTDPNTCAYNDFALVKVKRRDNKLVNPSIPFWGGPTGVDRDGLRGGERVYTYGNSSLRGGIEILAPHTGFSLGDAPSDGGWSHSLYTVTPGVPGDSGSAFVDARGRAIGTLSTLGLLPIPGSNNIGDLGRELRFARQHSGIKGLRLTRGTEPFRRRL
ncbi:hypothetical protein GCM10027020_18230 [Nocardioides salsibiostraticola]